VSPQRQACVAVYLLAVSARMGRMERARDELLEAAEAEVRRSHEVLLKLEAERDSERERQDQIANEPFETREQAAEISRRVGLLDEELGRLEEQIFEAGGDFRRAQEHVDSLLSGADDDDDADGDTGESLSVWDAADIWRSNGMDEDYRFGYSEDELRRAAEQG
jgi:septal ring factor EnvC (AmiA/AmiB activator)